MAGAAFEVEIKGEKYEPVLRALEAISPRLNRRIMDVGITRIITAIESELKGGYWFKLNRGDAKPLKTRLTSRHGGSGLVASIGPDLSDLPKSGSIGSELRYAGVHEFGGEFQVKAHSRKVKIKGKKVTQQVRAHSRTVPKRAFLKPASDRVRPRMPEIWIQTILEEVERS